MNRKAYTARKFVPLFMRLYPQNLTLTFLSFKNRDMDIIISSVNETFQIIETRCQLPGVGGLFKNTFCCKHPALKTLWQHRLPLPKHEGGLIFPLVVCKEVKQAGEQRRMKRGDEEVERKPKNLSCMEEAPSAVQGKNLI